MTTTTATAPDRTRRLSLYEALELFDALQDLFAPYCERIELAGSARRGKRENLKDLELCLVPKLEHQVVDLFGESTDTTNLQHAFALQLREQGILQNRLSIDGKAAFGPRLQRCVYQGAAVDIFCCLDPDQFGVKLMIATGPKEFNIRMVSPKDKGGRMPAGVEYRQFGYYRRALKPGAHYLVEEVIPMPEERDVFAGLGLDYIYPEDRK
jgi:DNA polymerase/3'-5' exonuclease PolX